MRRLLAAVFAAATLSAAGCGGPPAPAPGEQLRQQAVAKLDAMKQLAEAVAKNDPAGISSATELLTAMSMDVKANAAEAKEIVEIYKAKVKGKLKGEAAQQVQQVVDGIERELKG